jgi:hypothetical protein
VAQAQLTYLSVVAVSAFDDQVPHWPWAGCVRSVEAAPSH